MIPNLGDSRLDLLVAVYMEAASRLALFFNRMIDSGDSARRFVIYQQIIEQLNRLDGVVDDWTRRFIREFFDDADIKAAAALQSAGITAGLGSTPDFRAAEMLVNNMRGTLLKGKESIQHLANRVFRSPALEREFPELAARIQRKVAVGLSTAEGILETRAQVAAVLREQFVDGLVSVIGVNGRRYSFPLPYYAAMVAQATKTQAQTAATLMRAQMAGHDLVRVSPNPSLTKDYCDAYRGRVFSISGRDPVYPPLSRTPNGGPPFHPWCHHDISVFVKKFYTETAQKEYAQVADEFLMRPGENNVNRIAREWWAASREDRLPAQLVRG